MFEPLESRRLMDANLVRSGLSVIGSESDDKIILRQAGDQILVSINGRESAFDASKVRGVAIRGLGGNDAIDATRISLPLVVSGDAGNDSIYGTKGNDSLFGGSGNDYIDARKGDDYLDGQAGDDTLISNYGIDVIHGGKGNDQSQTTGILVGSGVEDAQITKADVLGIGAWTIRGEVKSVSEAAIRVDWTAVFTTSNDSFTIEPTTSRKFTTNAGNTFDLNPQSVNPGVTTGVHGVTRGPVSTTIDRSLYADPIRIYTGAKTITFGDELFSGEAATVFRTDVPANVNDVSLWRDGDNLMLDVAMTFGSGSTFVGISDAVRDHQTYNITAVAGYAGFGTADMYYPTLAVNLGSFRGGKLTFNIKQGAGNGNDRVFTKTIQVDSVFNGQRLVGAQLSPLFGTRFGQFRS